ncbi:hypothetical protein D9619_004923 [Psilocybe cf. subviscida]|uniref:MaoC-like domain-containing protein n=1 Tax=Psilocybe cf. subviscida TaxID=2480587 RepID=A0A8H5BQJ7_9AGAR|nr:hypothetical protein D9619_004923 [Psilocybe cf. subviscida]
MSSFRDPKAFADPEDSQLVEKAKAEINEPSLYTFSERDVILYNLGIGATERELKWTFEGDDEFSALPTFGVIPQFPCSSGISLDFLPNYNPAKLLHGEQYLNIKEPIPTSGELVSEARQGFSGCCFDIDVNVTSRILEVLDKGKAAAVTTIIETREKLSGKLIFENQSTVFIRGSGGFGGKRTGNGEAAALPFASRGNPTDTGVSSPAPVHMFRQNLFADENLFPTDRGAASATNAPPKRKPDAVVEEQTTTSQAALYRLSGDYNPLHILPEFAAIGGFDQPILHGLCFMGIAGKHVLTTYGPYKDIKVRFAGVVYPGETIVTEMWKEGDKVIFTAKVKERNSVALAAAAVTLVDSSVPKAKL